MNTKDALQNAYVKYKKSRRNAWVTFAIFLIYAVIGWKFMMTLYGSFMTMLLMVFFVIPFIPAALYILIGYGLLALVWSFVEDTDQAKRDMELFSGDF